MSEHQMSSCLTLTLLINAYVIFYKALSLESHFPLLTGHEMSIIQELSFEGQLKEQRYHLLNLGRLQEEKFDNKQKVGIQGSVLDMFS